MAAYWAAIDFKKGLILHPPGNCACKYPGFYHPLSPFPGMVMMKNSQGYEFVIVNDDSYTTFYGDWSETDSVYCLEYKEMFKLHFWEACEASSKEQDSCPES